MSVKILVGNVFDSLKGIPDCTVQCVVTSPPYYGLRDYGVVGQIGLEPSPEAYVDALVNVFREVRRVLKNNGTLWLNLGDSYWGGKGASSQAWSMKNQDRNTLQKSYHQISGKGETRPTDRKHPVIKPKDLIGIPWTVAFALRADGWFLRQDIIWNKPNPMPESMKDRCTKAHEYIFLLAKNKIYYYDQDAIREPFAKGSSKSANPLGRNKWSVWNVPTVAYKGAHFATFPPDLIEPCILAGSKAGDTILDPFNGSGTTGEVSIKNNRHYIGCELNPDYVLLTKRRLSKIL